jgi:hypothetical protein
LDKGEDVSQGVVEINQCIFRPVEPGEALEALDNFDHALHCGRCYRVAVLQSSS